MRGHKKILILFFIMWGPTSYAELVTLQPAEVCRAIDGSTNRDEALKDLVGSKKSNKYQKIPFKMNDELDPGSQAILQFAKGASSLATGNCEAKLEGIVSIDRSRGMNSSAIAAAKLVAIEVSDESILPPPPPPSQPVRGVVSPCAYSGFIDGPRLECNDFFSSVVTDSSSSSSIENLTNLMSNFILSEAVIFSEGDKKFCDNCFEKKFKSFKDLYQNEKDLNTTWVTKTLDKERWDKKAFESLKEKAKNKITNTLATNLAQQELFKLTNIQQQFEHMKFLYQFPDSSNVSCINKNDLQEKITKNCKDKGIGQNKIDARIKVAFQNFNEKTGDGVISLDKNLDALIKKVNISQKVCESNEQITREDFLSYEYDQYRRYGLQFTITELMKLVDPQQTINDQNNSRFPYLSISNHIVDGLLSGEEKSTELFSDKGTFPPIARKYLEENLGIKIPFSKDEYLKTGGLNIQEAQMKLRGIIGALFANAVVVDPSLNSTLLDWNNFKEVYKDFKASSDKSFGEYVQEGSSGKSISDEMLKRFKLVYDDQCKSIQDNLVNAICTSSDDLSNYSKSDIEKVAKDLNDELVESDNLTRSLGTLVIGSVACNEKNNDHSEQSLLGNLDQEISMYAQSDIYKEITSKSDSGNAGYLNTFAQGGHSCSKVAKKVDRSRFDCFYLQSCSEYNSLELETIQEYKSQPSVTSSSYRSVRGKSRDAIEAVNSGRSVDDVEKEFYAGHVEEYNSSRRDIDKDNLANNSTSLDLNNGEVDDFLNSGVDDIVDKIVDVDDLDKMDDSITDMLTESMNIFSPPESDYSMPYSSAVDISDRGSDLLQTGTISETQERANLIGELSDRFTPSELEKMTMEQLRELASQRDQMKDMGLAELEDKKQALEDEIAELEKKKLEDEITQLKKDKDKLAQEKSELAFQRKEQDLPSVTSTGRSTFTKGAGRSVASTPSSLSGVATSSATAGVLVDASSINSTLPQSRAGTLNVGDGSRQNALVGRELILTSKIPRDLNTSTAKELGPSIQDYLIQADTKNLLLNNKFVKFEKENNQLVAIYVQNEEGKLVRIEMSRLDGDTRELVNKYQRLTESEILAKEQSVDTKMAKLEEQMLKAQSIKTSRVTTLQLLNAQLMLFDQEIKARK